MPPLVALAVTPLALVAGAFVLVFARERALRRPLGPAAPPAPLTPDERALLERWERRLRAAVALVVTTYLVAFAVALSDGLRSAVTPHTALFVLGLACFAGAAVQFSARCPRCGFNLGFQSRLLVPERCERCSAEFGVSPPNPETPPRPDRFPAEGDPAPND